MPAGNAMGQDQPTTERVQLENEKLREEIRQLRAENDRADSVREDVLAYAPFITALVAIFGLAIPVLKEVRDNRNQRREELEQERAESRRRFDEGFAQAVSNLGSESESIRVSAVVSLDAFLRSEHKDSHDQVYRVICANLSVDQPEMVNRFLIRAFEHAIRLHLAAAQESGESPSLDLAHTSLRRARLAQLDLSNADLAFADLRGADLTESKLRRVRGLEVVLEKARLSRSDLNEIRFHKAHCAAAQFHEAVMTSAELRDADLELAQFFRARMQGAHLDRAVLRGASFDGANLSETFFRGAVFDDVALHNVVKSPTWRKAHFDQDVREKLERISKARGRRAPARGPSPAGEAEQ
jgi:uncharacterized protein YjbI with pentapeptide repeats